MAYPTAFHKRGLQIRPNTNLIGKKNSVREISVLSICV